MPGRGSFKTILCVFFFLVSTHYVLSETLPPLEKVWPLEGESLTYEQWYFKNPWAAVSPDGSGVIIAYVSGQLLKSRDFGESWKKIGQGLPDKAVYSYIESLFPPVIDYSPFDNATVILGKKRQSSGGGPFISYDGGETWSPLSICGNGPGTKRQNFKFSATSSAVFSRSDRNIVYFPVLSEKACQPVFVSLDGGKTIIPNPQCPYYKEQCKIPSLHDYCSDLGKCFNYGGNYWGGDMLVSVPSDSDGMFEFDFHGSLGYDYIARYKELDRNTGQLCTKSNVFVNLGTVPGYSNYAEGFFKSPVFCTEPGEMFTVCDIVQTGTLDGKPVYQKASSPFLARCGGETGGRFVFEFVSFLPAGYGSVLTDLKKAGPVVLFSVSDDNLQNSRFLAWSPYLGGTWIKFGEEGSMWFSVLRGTAGLFDIYYMASFTDGAGIFRSQLKVITLNTFDLKALTYSTETRYDFTGINTGLSGFNIESGGAIRKFWGRDFQPFTNLAGETRYVLFRGVETDIGADPENMLYSQFQDNSAFFDAGFYTTSGMSACTSNFTSIAVREAVGEDGTEELWAYLSSDAGIWRNRKFHEQYDAASPDSLLDAFEHVSGGYKCGVDCSGQIPSADFGNYCRKVILDRSLSDGTVLYAACRSGLWKGTEQPEGGILWTRTYDPPVKTGADAGVLDVLKSGCNIFISTSDGVLRSADGSSWVLVYSPRAGSGPVTAMAAFEECPDKIVLSQGSAIQGSAKGGILCSNDAGSNWFTLADLAPDSQVPVRKLQCIVEAGLDTVYFLTFEGALYRVLAYEGIKTDKLRFASVSSAPCAVSLSWKKDLGAESYSIMCSDEGSELILLAMITDTSVDSYIDLDAKGGRKREYTLKVDHADPCLSYGSRASVSVPADFSLSGISPSSGPRSGSSPIEISGTGLCSGCSVSVGGIRACTDCVYDPAKDAIFALTPEVYECTYPHYADVTVSDSCNEVTLGSGFRYELQMTMTPASFPDGNAGVVYPAVQAAAGGGVAPYFYFVSGGSLPPGMTFSGEGLLSGTPATAGSYVFSLTASDECGLEITVDRTLNVVQGASLRKAVNISEDDRLTH